MRKCNLNVWLSNENLVFIWSNLILTEAKQDNKHEL